MAKYKKWSVEEMDFIQNNHGYVKDEDLAAKLSQMTGENITTSMVRRQRRKLSLKKSKGTPRKTAVNVALNNESV